LNKELTKYHQMKFIKTWCVLFFVVHVRSDKFAESDYHKLAVWELESCPLAMESLGFVLSPPLFFIMLQLKIPVTGSKTGGYLYTTSFRDFNTNRKHKRKFFH
uniref:Uncharacterized protein n=1 Tax=Salarias fasciatus TaxID=181472 RepID=A0A672HQ75_SALFA